MFRSGRHSCLTRSTIRFITSCNRRTSSFAIANAPRPSNSRIQSSSRSSGLELTVHNPWNHSLQRFASTVKPVDEVDQKAEEKIANKVIQPHPEEVTVDSTVHQVFHEKGTPDEEEDVEMLAGVWSDIRVIKETFAFREVPREAYIIGMAGVLPYLGTSLSTVYLAWDINHAETTGSGFLVSGNTAELLLHIVEPLQIGYGAVIISFLGAIHWGLEWAKYGGVKGYGRYAYGVIAPAVAWPTLLFSIEYALITQFLTFTFLYYADAQAVVRGWAPHWYSTYRFVLTFVVGTSIVISLIGRGQIADKIGKLPGPADRMKAIRESQQESLEYEEREKRARRVAEEEEEMMSDEADE
ncbi:hypothetical protein MMC07_002585 [Pseudocyphellaria aurata]|nr:hypothetical protein [Pseudocyphellaria aurata]